MPRPDFIKESDINRWTKLISEDPFIPKELLSSKVLLEVCMAGLWLCEELEKLECHEVLIGRIQWTAGKISYGKDPWEVHISILEEYKNNTLVIELENEENSSLN